MTYLKTLHNRLLPEDTGVGWTPYLWLVYILFFFNPFYFAQPGAIEVIAIIVTLGIFLLLYFNGFWRRGWALLPNMAGIGLLGVAWIPFNSGASVFFIYAAAFSATLGPSRALGGIAVITLILIAESLYLNAPLSHWIPPAALCVLIGLTNVYYADKERRDAILRLTQQEIRQLAQVAERERISRDLHDLLGHTLSLITLKAELASRLVAGDPERAGAEMRDVETISRTALAQVREAVSGMNSRGLAGELEQAKLALKAAGIDALIVGKLSDVKPETEATLAMVLREAVTNVARHSQATRCSITLQSAKGEAMLEVRDDGHGTQDAAGSGIRGMQARLGDIGGRLEIDTSLGEWVLRAWVPV